MEQKVQQKDKWIKILTVSGAVAIILGIIYLINLNFGSYLEQIGSALKAILIPAAIAVFITYLINPLYQRIKKRTKKENFAAIITILIFFLIVIIIIGLIVFLATKQAIGLVDKLSENWAFLSGQLNVVYTYLVGLLDTSGNGIIAIDEIVSYLDIEFGINAFNFLFSGVTSFVYWFIMIVMMPVFLFFFLKEGGRIFNGFIKIVPKKWHKDDVDNAMRLASHSTEKYMRGKLISIGFLALFFSIGFTISFIFMKDINFWTALLYGLTFGILIALLDMIPYIGAGIGIILPELFVLIMSASWIEFLVFGIILIVIDIIGQASQKQLIEPIIMSKEVDVHPLAVFAGLLFFGALFGVVGLILATPIVATMKGVYHYLDEKYDLK